jgi:hypothetical protein
VLKKSLRGNKTCNEYNEKTISGLANEKLIVFETKNLSLKKNKATKNL